MERPRFAEPKRLCGVFGQQLLNELEVVQKKRIYIRPSGQKDGFVSRGLLEPENGEIHILKNDDIENKVITVLHELFHYNFPETGEEVIEQQAIDLYNGLNNRQKSFFEFLIQPE